MSSTLTDILKVGGNIVLNTLTGGIGSGIMTAANAFLGQDKAITDSDTLEIAQGKINTLTPEQQSVIYNHLESMARIRENSDIKALALREQTTKWSKIRPYIAVGIAISIFLPLGLLNLAVAFDYYTSHKIPNVDFLVSLNSGGFLLLGQFMGLRSRDKRLALEAQHDNFGTPKGSLVGNLVKGFR